MAKIDTKTHIAEIARLLFNENGYGATTTAALAEAVGKTEGNIWYHFKNKRALLAAITDKFLERSHQRTQMRPTYGGDILMEYAKMLHVFADEVRDFRFMYRDQTDYGEHLDALTAENPGLYSDTLAQFQLYFDVMVEKGLMDNKRDQIDAIKEASIIVIRYHLEVWREQLKVAKPGSGAVQDAFELHIKLLEPLMKPAAVQTLRSSLANYDSVPAQELA